MKKKITFIEVIIVIFIIIISVKGHQFWSKPEEVPEATSVPTEAINVESIPTLPTLITVIDTQETTWPCPNCSFGGY